MGTLARAACAAVLVGCTSLGPVPATTGVSPVPAPRVGGEAQIGAMPGFYTSQAVTEDPVGASFGQVSVAFDPATLLGVPGLVVAARLVGPEEDTQVEPVIGYRRLFGAGQGLAVGAFAFGTRSTGESDGATAETARAGGEIAVDMRLTPASRWIEAHLIAGGSVTYLSAEGVYCTDVEGRWGVDCPEPPVRQTRASATGAYPAGNAGVAVHLFRHRPGAIHGARVLGLLTVGSMPHVESSEQRTSTAYMAAGLALSLSFGEAAP